MFLSLHFGDVILLSFPYSVYDCLIIMIRIFFVSIVSKCLQSYPLSSPPYQRDRMSGASTTDVCHHSAYSPTCSSQGPSETIGLNPARKDSHSNGIDISPPSKVEGDEKMEEAICRQQIKGDGAPPPRRRIALLDRSRPVRKDFCRPKINLGRSQENEAPYHPNEHKPEESKPNSRMSSEHITSLCGKVPHKTFEDRGTPSALGGTASSSSTLQESSSLYLPFSCAPQVRSEEGKGIVTVEKCVEANASPPTLTSPIIRAQSSCMRTSLENNVFGPLPTLLPPQHGPSPSPCASHRTVLQKSAMTPLWPVRTPTTASSPVVLHEGHPSTEMHARDATSVRDLPILQQEIRKTISTDRSAADPNRTSTISSPTTQAKNAILPCQFKRAIQLLNGMVENERKTAIASQGRCRESGWVTKWTCSGTAYTTPFIQEEEKNNVHPCIEKPALFSSFSLAPSLSHENLSLTDGASINPPVESASCASKTTSGNKAGKCTSFPPSTASRSAVQAILPLQPVWMVTDGVKTLLLLDFNGSEEHQNYRESLPHYLEQLASTLNGKELQKSAARASFASKIVDRCNNACHSSPFIGPTSPDDAAGGSGAVSSPFLPPHPNPVASITWLSVNVEELLATTAPTAAPHISPASTAYDGACIPVYASRVSSLHLFPPSVVSPGGNRDGTRHTTSPTTVLPTSWHIKADIPTASSSFAGDTPPYSEFVPNTARGASVPLLQRALNAFHVPFAKSSALMLCLQGPMLVHHVLEEMCNGYLPLFLEGPYSSGVTLEGRWCGGGTPVSGSNSNSGGFSSPSLWKRSDAASDALEVDASHRTMWTALFPAAEGAQREAEVARNLGEVCIPFPILSDIQHMTVDHFPAYLPLPGWSENRSHAALEAKKEKRYTTSGEMREGRSLQSAPGSLSCKTRSFLSASRAPSGWDANDGSAGDASTPPSRTTASSLHSFVFQGEGKRLGGALQEMEVRQRMMKSLELLRSTTSPSFSSSPISSSRVTVPSAPAPRRSIRMARGNAGVVAPSPLSSSDTCASTISSSPSLSPLPALPLSPAVPSPFRGVLHRSTSTSSSPSFLNGRREEREANDWCSSQRWSQPFVALPPAPGGRSGVEKPSIPREELSYVGVLIASGPQLKLVWAEYVMQRRSGPLAPSTFASSGSRIRKSSTSPTLCRTVLIYTPFGKIYLERLLPSIERWDRPHSTPTFSGGKLSPAVVSSSSSSFDSPSPVFLDIPMVTIEDCRNSLLKSAFGRSMRLKSGQVQFIVAPGGPILCNQEVICASQAVLRMVTGRKSI